MIKYFCDVCGMEEVERDLIQVKLYRSEDTLPIRPRIDKTIDICEKCYQRLLTPMKDVETMSSTAFNCTNCKYGMNGPTGWECILDINPTMNYAAASNSSCTNYEEVRHGKDNNSRS